ncbi:MAG: insulinase family protein [Gemmatimonadetes bacterium]|nr:insulinase family protein [Gemmatimonadota bacterium]
MIEHLALPNGIPVLFARVDGLPVVTLSAVIRAGGVDEPTTRAGLASLTGDLLESGAAGSAGSDIADALERLGVQLAVGSSWDFCHAELTGLTGRVPRGSEILADLIRAPDFPEPEVERLRSEHVAHVLQGRADPRSLANEMAGRYIFSSSTPFSRPLGGTTETIPSLTREDIASFHRANFAPARTGIVIAGAIGREEAEQMIQPFAEWSVTAGERTEITVQPRSRERQVVIVDRPGSVQSEVRVGHVGVPRAHPDYFPILVMNTVLGGAFTSRLNMSLRERHGFTYGVSSAFSMRRAAGPFLVATAVQTEVTGSAVREIFRELAAIREAPVSDAELVDARNYVAGVFPLTLQTTSGVASRLAEMVLYDLPRDYFEKYPGEVLAVQADEVERVANQYLAPDEAAVVIVGDAARIRGELEALELGPVEVLDAGSIV